MVRPLQGDAAQNDQSRSMLEVCMPALGVQVVTGGVYVGQAALLAQSCIQANDGQLLYPANSSAARVFT
jgi:hypothetical protein